VINEEDVEFQGLSQAFEDSGFNCYIDFKDFVFDPKVDYAGSGGYGDVFRCKWEGVEVAIKKFGKRQPTTKKALKDLIKEIEVIN
jgi:hypothetical protein